MESERGVNRIRKGGRERKAEKEVKGKQEN